eukprot:1190437-Prorocentrum_minimum.AAC.1
MFACRLKEAESPESSPSLDAAAGAGIHGSDGSTDTGDETPPPPSVDFAPPLEMHFEAGRLPPPRLATAYALGGARSKQMIDPTAGRHRADARVGGARRAAGGPSLVDLKTLPREVAVRCNMCICVYLLLFAFLLKN